MTKLWTRMFGNKCEHENTLTVSSVGVERTVCEDCGHVSFFIAPALVASHELTTRLDDETDLEKVG